jgi:hypothetical protein
MDIRRINLVLLHLLGEGLHIRLRGFVVVGHSSFCLECKGEMPS